MECHSEGSFTVNVIHFRAFTCRRAEHVLVSQVEDLARLSIKNKPAYVGVDDSEQESTVDGLEQVTLQCFDVS